MKLFLSVGQSLQPPIHCYAFKLHWAECAPTSVVKRITKQFKRNNKKKMVLIWCTCDYLILYLVILPPEKKIRILAYY